MFKLLTFLHAVQKKDEFIFGFQYWILRNSECDITSALISLMHVRKMKQIFISTFD